VISIVFAASVQSSVHMALGISDRNNTIVFYQCLKEQEQRKKLKKTKEETKKGIL